jgi:hypothetical protein
MQTIEKQVSNTLRTIDSFFSKCVYEVSSTHETLNKAVAKTEKKNEGFFFEFSKMTIPNQENRHKITYAPSLPTKFSNNFEILEFDLVKAKCNFSFGFSGHTSVSGIIKEFTSNSLERHNNSYYRAVIIREGDHALSGFFAHNNTLKVGTTTYGSGVLELNIKNIPVHLFSFTSKENKTTYFIIETQDI